MLNSLKGQAEWKLSPDDQEMSEGLTADQSIRAESEETDDDGELWNYWSPDMLAEDGLPKIGFLRLRDVLSLIPVSESTWWVGVKTGRFPKSIKITEKTTGWDVNDIRALVVSMKQND